MSDPKLTRRHRIGLNEYFDLGQKRTCAVQLGLSALCQKRTSPALFDHLGAGEQGRRDFEAERPGRL
jgi:hypothetical protein